MMPDLTALIDRWGYGAIFLTVLVGNVGVPVPEETILILAAYLLFRGTLQLGPVLAVGVVSAVIGDNLGYWVGRRYGLEPMTRFSHKMLAAPYSLEAMRRFVFRYGPLAVFIARFLPGLRFMAGPLAGAMGLPPLRFFTANLLGAIAYVPAAVAVGYAVGYGFAEYLDRILGVGRRVEHLALAVVLVGTVAWLGWRFIRTPRGLG